MSQIGSKKGRKAEDILLTERAKLTVEQQIEEFEKELKNTKYNKATQHHIGLVKAKIARLRDKQSQRSGGKSPEGFTVRKSGDATVVILGFPSAGKSTLLNALTNAESLTAAYAFTTLSVIPGVLEYKDAKIQILDVPGIVEGAARGSGKGREVLSVLRSAELVMIILDAQYPDHYDVLLKEVHDSGLRLDQSFPDVRIVKSERGGLKIGTTVKLTNIDKLTIEKIMLEYKLNNASLVIRQNITIDQFIDVLENNRHYPKSILVVNKIDAIDDSQLRFLHEKFKNAIFISAEQKININNLKDSIFNKLDFIRIYTKDPGKAPDMKEPMIMLNNSTIKEFCTKLHRDFVDKFKYARLWGPSAKFPGQRKMLRHKLKDGDIVEIHLK